MNANYIFQNPGLSFLIISFQAIYVPADDLTDPTPAITFTHLDATTVLSRGVAERDIYPAVVPLDSTSRAEAAPGLQVPRGNHCYPGYGLRRLVLDQFLS